MIRTAIKHWIFEVCIEQMFNGFFKNFVTVHRNIKYERLKEGDTFDYVTVRNVGYVTASSKFYGCKIIGVGLVGFVMESKSCSLVGDHGYVNRLETEPDFVYKNNINYDDVLDYKRMRND